MEMTHMYPRHRMSIFPVVSKDPLAHFMRIKRGEVAYTKELDQGDLCAVHHHIVLVLIPVLEEYRIKLEYAVGLLARE